MNSKNLSIYDNSPNIIFITGGTKSGKSEFAEHLAKQIKNLTYVALSENNNGDQGWEKKINKHKKRRPKDWKLIETTDLLFTLNQENSPLLIDSIGGFVMKSIGKEQNEWSTKMNSLISLLMKKKAKHLLLENRQLESVSEYKIGNTYIERIGELQKRITKISKDNWLAINGRAIKIDEISIEIPT